jgi:hypothetical protein
VRHRISIHRAARRLAFLAGPLATLALATPAHAALGISTFTVVPVVPGTNTPDKQAGGHPDLKITTGFSGASDNLKNLTVHLPPGLVGNPNAATKCTQAQFDADTCPGTSVVGTVTNNVTAKPLGLPVLTQDVTDNVYDVAPSPGEPARLGIWVHRR